MPRSVSISRSERQQISHALVKNSKPYAERDNALQALIAVTKEVVFAAMGKHKDAYLGLPERLQHLEMSIYVYHAPGHNTRCLSLGDMTPAPITRFNFDDIAKPLGKKLLKALDAFDDADDAVKELRSDIDGVLEAYTRTAPLFDVLPEAANVMPNSLHTKIYGGKNLPSVRKEEVDHIRQLIQPAEAA